jgi:hypothetical protein
VRWKAYSVVKRRIKKLVGAGMDGLKREPECESARFLTVQCCLVFLPLHTYLGESH